MPARLPVHPANQHLCRRYQSPQNAVHRRRLADACRSGQLQELVAQISAAPRCRPCPDARRSGRRLRGRVDARRTWTRSVRTCGRGRRRVRPGPGLRGGQDESEVKEDLCETFEDVWIIEDEQITPGTRRMRTTWTSSHEVEPGQRTRTR